MDLGSNFASKLELYLLMGKSMKGAAAAKLIQDATSAPGVFVFGELFELTGIQELSKNEQYKKSYALLELFAYKTFQHYTRRIFASERSSDDQVEASVNCLNGDGEEGKYFFILPYPQLISALAMPSIRDLEDLIIDAIYLDILRGKLDQKEAQLEVEYTMGRDLEPGKVDALLNALKDWASTTSAVLATLDSQISSIASQTAAAKLEKAEYEAHVQQLIKEINDKKETSSSSSNYPPASASSGGSALRKVFSHVNQSSGGDRMDVDEPEVAAAGSKGKNRKAPQAETKPVRKRNRF
ncbi:hypothetical protein D9757_006731 [Collybiopsis confluens]|uniref:PCI domain-containing protein n=1 Tax=Collybiopsis confluens TaxID=2823264 RepID=A0A8H5HLI5_9AGAR|nr:hypothetical protein D9757_006731 [Collybiopsis confluens]